MIVEIGHFAVVAALVAALALGVVGHVSAVHGAWRSLAATLARKRYIDPGQDALVPGEENDNESSLYAEITRSLGRRVDGAFRLGWQKVETNFNGAYYSRFGGAFFLRVRPAG